MPARAPQRGGGGSPRRRGGRAAGRRGQGLGRSGVMATVRARGAVWSLVVSSLLIVACTSNPEEDEVAPACNGVSPTGIQYDQLADGGCLAHPVTLLGSGGEGDSCSE